MKVLELYENQRISTAKEFKDSFSREQWENIICYYISIMDKDVGVFSSVPLTQHPAKMTQMAQDMREKLGLEMSDSTQPQAWRALASQYGIRAQAATWDGFYNILLPHASHVCKIQYASSNEIDDIRDTDITSQLYTTTETVEDILAWIPTNLVDPLTYANPNSVKDAVEAMMAGAVATPSRSGPGPNNQDGNPTATWEEWVGTTASSDVNRTPIKDMLIHALNRLPDGTVSKQQIAQAFLDWLRTADNVIANARERYTQ
jgi:hypothetical protein